MVRICPYLLEERLRGGPLSKPLCSVIRLCNLIGPGNISRCLYDCLLKTWAGIQYV